MAERDPHEAVDFLIKHAPLFAKAKADRVHLEEFRKSLKARLMQAFNSLPLGAQEREAYAHQEYTDFLEGLKVAVEVEENLRWMLIAAQTRVEVWRSQESTARAQDRATT